MVRTLPCSLAVTALCCLAPVAFAAETGTGATAQADTGAMLQDTFTELQRDLLLYQFSERTQLQGDAAAKTDMQHVEDLWRKRKADARARCREQLDATITPRRFQTLARCFRDDLALDKSYYEKRKEFVVADLTLSEKARIRGEAKLEDLIDAQAALIDGVDGGIYGTEQQLLDAKHKLVELYLRPEWAAATQARADRTLGWIAVLTHDLQAMQEEGADDAQTDSVYRAAQCLLTAADQLLVVAEENDYKKIKDLYSQAVTALRSCNSPLKDAAGQTTGTTGE